MSNLISNGIIQLKKLWKNGAFHIMAGGFLNKFISMFGSIVIVRLLTKEQYGVLSYMENLYGYLLVLAGFGLSNSILRYVVLADDNQEKSNYFQYALKNGFIINVVLVVIGSLVCFFYPHAQDFEIAKYLLIVMIFALPFQDIFNNGLFMERAMFSNDRYTYFSISITILMLVTKVLGAIFGGLEGIVFCQVIVYAVMAVFLLNSIRKKYFPKEKIINKNVKIKNKKEVNSYSLQYMITNGLWTIFMLNDVFFIGLFCQDASILADYRVAYVLPGCLSIISSAIGTFVSPYFVKNENNLSWVRTNYWKVFFATIAVIGAVVIGILVFAKYIIVIIYGKQYLNIIPLMVWLLVAAFINCALRFTSANLLAAMGQIKYNMIVSMVGICIQVVLDIILIPKFGAYGAAYASVVVYLIMSGILFVVFSKKYHLFSKNNIK